MKGFAVRDTISGKGVFADRQFAKGTVLFPFTGPVLPESALPTPYATAEDHYIQVGPKRFMGPSGGIDDLVNHSCDPNAGLVFRSDRIDIVAIRDIPAGEEIAFDYSTTMRDDPWTMRCACGSPTCRGVVAEFARLPDDVKKRYLELGIVPSYVTRP